MAETDHLPHTSGERREICDRILEESNENHHFRNHIHLTNCIHLKNHMHNNSKKSPVMADRSLVRDLIVLQRSRSLKDPSMSPSVVEVNGRRSVESERYKFEDNRYYGGSPLLAAVSDRGNNGGPAKDDVINPPTLAEQLKEVRFDSDDVVSSPAHFHHHHGLHAVQEKPRARRRKFRGTRRGRTGATTSREVQVAPNSYNFPVNQEEKSYVDVQNVTRAPRNGCGIPWNWSRIHNRGMNFLDIAGKSFSCGTSDPKSKKAGQIRDFSCTPLPSDKSSSQDKYNAEAHPLLVDAFGSQESTDNNAHWVHDYSGELGIYADNLLKNEAEFDSDLASEARSGDHHCKSQKNHNRHENLTQKYMPRSFRDLVGQNLVAQALLNAATRKKVGSVYVFYGPHGTGKTSCARLFARALNCQSQNYQKPCGSCNSCTENRSIIQFGPVGSFDFEGIMEVLEKLMMIPRSSLQYKVLIFDDCENMPQDCWNALLKAFDRAPKGVVFILVGLNLDSMPHVIVTRCQKFFFPKLKDADIIYKLQFIASKENLEIDKDALKLIASRSDGSLRDAEMTLDQLSLLGQRITVPLVQEMVGLMSNEKLVDLLDLALSADTVNTVKNLREIMESGIEPLALMSQLATVITDILAGSYDFMKESLRRKFFRQELSKEDMEKLRQALKILSEAEKQLRLSTDRLTWLTAALLQLAPDKQYLLPTSSSAETSFRQASPPRKSNAEKHRFKTHLPQTSGNGAHNKYSNNRVVMKKKVEDKTILEIWSEVLEKIRVSDVQEFMYREGKLQSVSFGAVPTVQLMLGSRFSELHAEKYKINILQAFESVLESPVTIELRYALRNGGFNQAVATSPNPESSSQVYMNPAFRGELSQPKSANGEIHEEREGSRNNENGETTQNQSRSIMRNKVLLSNVIQQESGWSKKKAVSIAEKLEQENIRLESKSRSLLCWKTESKGTRRKLSRLKIRTKKSQALLKFVSCGKYAYATSPR